jgi:hypothetical protein
MGSASTVIVSGGSSGGGGRAPYLGAVATRGRVPTYTFATTTLMSRSMHYARDEGPLKILVPNFLVDVSGGQVERGLGATATVTASIEYPAATFTQVKFSGSASGTVPDNSTLLSDFVNVAIPRNAQFWVRMYMVNANGFLVCGTGQEASEANGEFCNTFDGDKTMSGTVSSQFAGYTFAPLAILGMTRRPSVLGIGPSTMAGDKDTQDATGDIGTLMRSIGPNYGYTNISVAGDSFAKFIVGHANRIAIGQYFTHVFFEMKNDDISGGTAPVVTKLQTMCGYFPGNVCMALTTTPYTSGAWTLADQTDQTVAANFGAWNTALKALPSPVAAVFDSAAVVATGVRGSQYWNADGTVAKWTPDGIHEKQFATLAIQTALQASITAAIGS